MPCIWITVLIDWDREIGVIFIQSIISTLKMPIQCKIKQWAMVRVYCSHSYRIWFADSSLTVHHFHHRYREALRRYQRWTCNLLNAMRLSRLWPIAVAHDKKNTKFHHTCCFIFFPFLPSLPVVFHFLE